MTDEATMRSLLIESCHSSSQADAYFRARLGDSELLARLVTIAMDSGDHGGDAPLQAAYYASQFPACMLAVYESALLELLPRADGYGGHVALALGRMRSSVGKNLVIKELGDGSRFDAWLFKGALAYYEDKPA